MLPPSDIPDQRAEIERLFEHACALDRLGRNDEARDAYVAVIKRERSHVRALAKLGTLLYHTGYRAAARMTFGEALKYDPNDLRMLASFARSLYENQQFAEANVVYRHALTIDPGFAPAHQGISHVLERLGDYDAARVHRERGFTALPISVGTYRGQGRPVVVLAISSAHHGNVPLGDALDDRRFLTIRLFADYYDANVPFPRHDAVFNAIGDADRCQDSLAAAERLLQTNHLTAINPPAAVAQTRRVQIAERLNGIDGLIAPKMRELSKDGLGAIERFPVLIRPPGYHTGEWFEEAGDPARLEQLAASLPGERLLAIEKLDARGADGTYRKYRVLVIGGHIYPIHLVRSSNWKVHGFSADRPDASEGDTEERAFLTQTRDALGPRAMAALEEAARRIGLDYFGIDFGIGAHGDVLAFEANATMRAAVPVAGEPGFSEPRRSAALAAVTALRDLVAKGPAAKYRTA